MIAGVKATKPSTILIVEDDPMMQLGLSRLLSAEPQFTIVGQVEDGNSAIDVASKLKPDIILMDIGLPDIDGIAVASQIKALLPHTRILMLTSHTSDTEVLAALSCGTEGYCIKALILSKVTLKRFSTKWRLTTECKLRLLPCVVVWFKHWQSEPKSSTLT